MLSALFATGALLTKFNIEAFGSELERRLADHVGADVSLGDIYVDGLRGLVVEEFELALTAEGGPVARISTPRAEIRINAVDLLYGKVTVERIEMHRTKVVVERPEDSVWYDPDGFDLRELFDIPASHGFRVTGRDCSLEVRNIVGDTNAMMGPVHFDVARLIDAEDLSANIEGYLSGDAEKQIRIRLSMASFDDFDLRVTSEELSAADVNVFLPSERQFVEAGWTSPTIWVGARPNRALLVSLEAAFEELLIRDQPEFLSPATGHLTAHASYSADTTKLTVTAAKAESEELSGILDGEIDFSGEYPGFDLRLQATKLPVQQLLDHWGLEGRIEDYGATELTLDEPQTITLALRGNSDQPELIGEVRAPSGKFVFAPQSPNDTKIEMALGSIDVAWNSSSETLHGAISILDGTIDHKPTGIVATHTMGTLRIDEKQILAEPLTATITGMPFSASLAYNFDSKDADVTLSGVLARVEETALYDLVRDTLISGDVNIRQAIIKKRGERYDIEADVDGAQCRVEYAWWFDKRAGIGANVNVKASLLENKALDVEANGEVASTSLQATMALRHRGGDDSPWQLHSASAQSDHIDVTAIAQCLKLPYHVSGGIGHDGRYQWDRDLGMADGWRLQASAVFDEVRVLPSTEGATTPMVFKDLIVDSESSNSDVNSGNVTLRAKSARMPAIKEPWLLAVDKTPPEGIDFKDPNRQWRYFLEADAISLPPWEGTGFKAEAFSNHQSAGFSSYAANIGEGRLEGSYSVNRGDNHFTSTVSWDHVPAETLIAHLGFPDVLEGSLSGGISYNLDKDDPSTVKGTGQFKIADGRFSADYIASLIEGQTVGDLGALPPSLRFSEFSGSVELDRDIVRTPAIHLVSDALNMDGQGQYIRDGDMDYQIQVAVSPETAERIPAMRDSMNLRGHRISQTDIELEFRLAGPTFNPQGRLEAMPPVGVTLVSGAIEVTSQVIDFPRKILVDLLKMGGGMLGASKSSP